MLDSSKLGRLLLYSGKALLKLCECSGLYETLIISLILKHPVSWQGLSISQYKLVKDGFQEINKTWKQTEKIFLEFLLVFLLQDFSMHSRLFKHLIVCSGKRISHSQEAEVLQKIVAHATYVTQQDTKQCSRYEEITGMG